MRRLSIIITLLLLPCISLFAELPVDFLVKSEYKKDTIDYSDTIIDYYREKVSVLFSEESRFNLSCIYLQNGSNTKYTWNLLLYDMSANFSFIAGNYFVNFGSGLLIGRKRIYDPDIFSFNIGNNEGSSKSVFAPCNTGNPMYAFNGLGCSFYYSAQDIQLALNTFYSVKERFIDEDSYESNTISSTLDTLDTKTGDEYNHNEPVEIHTGGAMLSAGIFDCIVLGTYYLNADIRSRYKEEITWEYTDTADESVGICSMSGFGIFSQYRDDYFSLFVDWAATQKETIQNGEKNKKEYGQGLLYKLNFSSPFLKMAIAGKQVESSFYSPYSSSIGDDYPESAWFFDTEIKPYTNLKLSTRLSSQKRTSVSSMDNTPPVIKKEILSLKYSYGRLEKVELGVKRRERSDEEKDVKEQLHSSACFAPVKQFNINFSSAFHRINKSNSSRIFTAGILLAPTGSIRINFNYVYANIYEGNSIYAVISPMRESSTRGFYMKQDSSAFIIKSEIKAKEIFLSGRYLYLYKGSKTLHQRLEFFASGYF